MTNWQAFFLGVMVAWSPAMLVVAVLLMRAKGTHHEP